MKGRERERERESEREKEREREREERESRLTLENIMRRKKYCSFEEQLLHALTLEVLI